MRRISGRAISITLIAVPVLGIGAAAVADSPSDSRAVFYPGNVTTCGGVGLGSDKQIGAEGNRSAGNGSVSGTAKTNAGSVQPGTGEELDVATVGDTAVHAVVIHGGNGYNKYANADSLPPRLQPDQHYIAPLTNGGNVPTLSHWFVCYADASGTPVPAGTLGMFGITGLAAVGLALGALSSRRRRRYAKAIDVRRAS
jgi:hypothetical protein